MNIKELQTQKAKNEAIMKSIKNGKAPLISYVNTFIKNKFKFSPVGTPSFKPAIGKKYDISNKAEFNNMLIQIHSDLEDLYDADNLINNEILSTSSYYDSEKNRLSGVLNRLQNEIDTVMTIVEQPQAKGSTGETFDDFNNIEFDGDAEKNIPYTTSYIDLRTKNASINTVLTKKISLKDATIKFNILTANTGSEELSDINHCLGDNSNETWLQKVSCDSNNQLEYNVGIQMTEEAEINTVIYTASSPRKQTVSLVLIDKDGNRKSFNPITTIEKAEWNFKNTSAAAILFGITKQEADGTDGITYEYYIGAKNISIFNNIHAESGVVVSSGEDIPGPFSKVMLTAQEVVPASTDINYYVGLDNGVDEVGWMLVENKEVAELNLLAKERCNIGESVGTISTKNTIGHNLGTLDHEPVKKTMTLYVGVDMWAVQELKNPTSDSIKELFTSPITSFAPMSHIEYNAKGKTAYLYTTYADFDEPVVLTGRFYKYGDSIHSIYVNGSKINGIDNKKNVEYKLRIARGQNKIQILVTNDNANDDKFGFDAYLQEHATITRAIESTKETDEYELRYGLHVDDFTKYCIIGNDVVVNYDATAYKLDYVADYRYNDVPSRFENAKIRVMAVLVTRNEQVTPKLSSYQVTIL